MLPVAVVGGAVTAKDSGTPSPVGSGIPVADVLIVASVDVVTKVTDDGPAVFASEEDTLAEENGGGTNAISGFIETTGSVVTVVDELEVLVTEEDALTEEGEDDALFVGNG